MNVTKKTTLTSRELGIDFLYNLNDVKKSFEYTLFPNNKCVLTILINSKVSKRGNTVILEKDNASSIKYLLVNPFDNPYKINYKSDVNLISVCFPSYRINSFLNKNNEFTEDLVYSDFFFNKSMRHNIEEIINSNQNMKDKLGSIEDSIIELHKDEVDPIVKNSIEEIEKNPQIKIYELADRLSISSKNLTKKFKQNVGRTPDSFKRINRFVKVLKENPIKLSDLSHSVGFYDQAHMIRELKKISNLTPKVLKSKKNLSKHKDILWLC